MTFCISSDSLLGKVAINRMRFTIPSQAEGKRQKALDYDHPLSHFGLKDGGC